MSVAPLPSPPAWQTEELQDEWVELDQESESDEAHNVTYGTRSISLTAPLATHIQTSNDSRDNALSSQHCSPGPVGTFLVREDVLNAPLLPKTPGRHKKGLIKDFFSPMPLERMFEPPSPPATSTSTSKQPMLSSPLHSSDTQREQSPEEDEIVETDMPDMASFHGRKASIACQFTFAVPRDSSLNPSGSGTFPQAQSTPNPPFVPSGTAPMTDPRLRLFQFQYDTYTRDHLSAMVDSIAINTPSGTGTTPSPTSLNHGLSRVSEVTGSLANTSHLRSTKRVKLSPRSDFYGEGAGAGASIARPKIYGKDYVGESRSLMQQIKQARDFSTISTVASAQHDSPTPHHDDEDDLDQPRSFEAQTRASLLAVPDANSNTAPGSISSKSSTYSSSTYRQQAAALMAQIKSDMKGQKRLFSGETDISHITSRLGDKTYSSTHSTSPDFKSAVPLPEEKDNQHQPVLSHRRASSVRSNASRHKASPRKVARHSTNELEDRIVDDVSNMSIEEHWSYSQVSAPSALQDNRKVSRTMSTHLVVPSVPPSYPSSSLRAGANEDLNRFVSSSTASGTTLTAGSAPSFVKHPGPAHIRTIAPTDLPQLPERLGDMLFDKVMMKWVKNTAQATGLGNEMEGYLPTEDISEDPFGDIESLRDDSRGRDSDSYAEVSERRDIPGEMSRIDEQSELDDEEEIELTSFSTDDPSALVVDVMTGVDTDILDDDQTTDSEDDVDEALTITNVIEADYDSDDISHLSEPSSRSSPPDQPSTHLPPPTLPGTPRRGQSIPTSSTTPTVRSALKSHTATPTSALKDPNRRKYQTPSYSRGHRRSVSFSDGKREGPIQGLSQTTDEDALPSADPSIASINNSIASGVVQSARSKRIAQMMNALEDSESDESPSKASSSGRPEELQALSARTPSVNNVNDASGRVFSRSHTHRLSFTGDANNGNATFLTECSFAVSHDRLVEVITDVQPFLPRWEELGSIDLSNKKLESVARLKEFLPRLDALSLNANQLAWLSGVPGTVRTLSVASNILTGITSYSHLLNLENLDISRNEVDSLRQLACLRHLRELKADGNKITNIDGLQRMDGLVKLSLQDNSIRSIDLAQYRWTRLEMLNMSQNRLDNIHGLASLQALVALNIDNNEVGELAFDSSMPKLRILRVSGNRLHQLHAASMPNLRTLYADNNSLSTLVKVDRLTKLENLSLRNQSGRGLNLLTRDVRDVKRLYLSGNPLKAGFLKEPCYNLLYLELAACRLTALPEDLSRLTPNLRALNLNYNFLEDARPLEGLTRLRKLTIIGSRLKGTKPLIRILQRMPDVEMLDFRMNPCTLGWYLPLLVKDLPGALQPSEGTGHGKGERAGGWQELDSKFRRDLPDESYIGRLAYRGLIMRACARIRMLDGVEVTEKERAKAHHLLLGILSKGKKSKGKGKSGGSQ